LAKKAPRQAYSRNCGYCGRGVKLYPPYSSNNPLNFWAPCPYGNCAKPTKYYFINGKIESVKTVVNFAFYGRLKAGQGIMIEIAETAAEACETAYRESNRGAAAIFRVAAELLALSENFAGGANVTTLPKFGVAIKEIENGRRFKGLKQERRDRLVACLKYLRNLGDSAAHPRITPPERTILMIPARLDEGRAKLEDAVKAVYGW
jgi:hypothetical protein